MPRTSGTGQVELPIRPDASKPPATSDGGGHDRIAWRLLARACDDALCLDDLSRETRSALIQIGDIVRRVRP